MTKKYLISVESNKADYETIEKNELKRTQNLLNNLWFKSMSKEEQSSC